MASVLWAFAAAFSNALNMITQHVASTSAPKRVKGLHLARYLLTNSLWLFGAAAMVASFLLQAVALDHGELSVVQSIMVTELVFTLVLGHLWLRRPVAAAAWLAGLSTSGGLALFLVMSEPQGGHNQATAAAWLPALATFGGLTAVLAVAGGRGSPLRRAACYGAAAGIAWAALASFLKSTTDVLSAGGPTAVLRNGAIYGVIGAGILGTVLAQAALRYGPLSVSQPLMVILDPLVSIVLGVWIFGEHFRGSPWKITLAVVGFTVMVVGVMFLVRTAPSLEATPEPAPTL